MRKWKRKIRFRALALLFGAMLLGGCSPEEAGNAGTGEGKRSADAQVLAERSPEDGQKEAESRMEVHFLDVGQGDSIYISCDGYHMLVDAGNNDKGTAVWSYLKQQGVETLDYVIGTHPDADHIGGLDVILYKFDCGTILMPDVENETRTYEDVLQVMEDKGYKAAEPEAGDAYSLGEASFTVIAPSGEYGSDLNNASVGILLEHGENRFLMTGDAEEAAEEDILEKGLDISADVYKAGHHGSNTASTEDFLEAVDPSYAVISCGEGNSYGHPHAEVMNRLRNRGVEVFRTDEQGTIVAVSDGKDLFWNCAPAGSWQSGEPEGSLDLPEEMVYITETGEKYHKAGCSSLKNSSEEITLSEAKERGYAPCAKCRPADG